MAVELTVPALGESITEAVVGKWHKKVGDAVAVDEPVVVLETDKVTIDVPAPAAGTIAAIAHVEGDTVKIGSAHVCTPVTDPARMPTIWHRPAPRRGVPRGGGPPRSAGGAARPPGGGGEAGKGGRAAPGLGRGRWPSAGPPRGPPPSQPPRPAQPPPWPRRRSSPC